jgi:hypothetical protein
VVGESFFGQIKREKQPDRTLLKVRWRAGGECVVFSPTNLRKSVKAGEVDDVF